MAYTNSSAGSAQAGIRYTLRNNKMVSAVKGATAYTMDVEAPALSLENLANRMVRQGSAYSSRDIISVFDEMTEVIIQCLNEGSAVNLGSICRFRPTIKGTLASEDAELSAANLVTVAVSAGSKIRDMVRDATTIRISGSGSNVPTLTEVRDATTMRTDGLTSGGNFLVTGSNLSWDTAAEDEGFFLVVNGEEVKATLQDLSGETSALLSNSLTWTTAGDAITLMLRTRRDGTLREYTYAGTLTTILSA